MYKSLDALLDMHRKAKPTVFAEMLIGVSTNTNMPPSQTESLLPTIRPCGWYGETRDATTEIVFGAGSEHEYGQGVRYA